MTPEHVAFTDLTPVPRGAQQQDPERMVLDGTMGGQKIRLQLRRFDHTKLQLLTRGFNWIQERPFNR